jgi:hypothetical protein
MGESRVDLKAGVYWAYLLLRNAAKRRTLIFNKRMKKKNGKMGSGVFVL